MALSPEQKKVYDDAVKRNLSAGQVAALNGLSVGEVTSFIKSENLTPLREDDTPEEVAKFAKDNGLSSSVISKAYQVPEDDVKAFMATGTLPPTTTKTPEPKAPTTSIANQGFTLPPGSAPTLTGSPTQQVQNKISALYENLGPSEEFISQSLGLVSGLGSSDSRSTQEAFQIFRPFFPDVDYNQYLQTLNQYGYQDSNGFIEAGQGGPTTPSQNTGSTGTNNQFPDNSNPGNANGSGNILGANVDPVVGSGITSPNWNPNLPRTGPTASNSTIPSTASYEELWRQNNNIQQQADIASGNVQVPGAGLEAVEVPLGGTVTPNSDIQQVSPVAPVTGGAPVTSGVTGVDTANPAAAVGGVTGVNPSTIDNISQVGSLDTTTAATGSLSDGATAALDQPFVPSEGSTAEAATIDAVPPGAEVEAAIGSINPEDLAEGAKVAGLETARISNAKNQLRKAGLSDADIAQFANDPTALEMRLSDFTEEQRGIIGGLPEEALVSTQMEQLLAGIESGDIPVWAKPAVESVEFMLARRGLSASTIGQTQLTNAIIQSAIPLAQSNAQAIQTSVLQQRGFEQQAALTEASFKQQATLQNAQNSFNLNIRNLDAQQQANLANSQFMQTITLQNASNRQQVAIQNAVNMANLDAANLDSMTKMAVQNAQNFLSMDLSNLSNEQQAILVDTQFNQQRMLTDASAQNAALQFNATSEMQVQQFIASLDANIQQFNAQQLNAMRTFNSSESNKMAAMDAGNAIQVAEFNNQLMAQIDQFNAQQELARRQWNAANAQAVEQSNVQWRRQANTANTAAQNAINQQTVQNAFSLTAQAQAALWQELRDQATFDQQSYENSQDREAQLYASALGNESAASNNFDQSTHLMNLARSFFLG